VSDDSVAGRSTGLSLPAQLTRQGYGKKPLIQGVVVLDLSLHSDEGGDFCEVARLTADGALAHVPGFKPRQVSYSVMEPGTVKAWHLHYQQDDVWFIPPYPRVLVGLLDAREDSPSYETRVRLAMGSGIPKLLRIPRGVAHGIANLGTKPAALLYFADNTFNAESPDEYRLPYDVLGGEFWSIVPG